MGFCSLKGVGIMEPGQIPTDAIISLLMFLMGAPALVFQLASNDVREVITQHNTHIPKKYLLPAFTGFLIVFAIYGIDTRWLPDKVSNSLWHAAVGALLALSLITVIGVFPSMGKKRIINELVDKAEKGSNGQAEYGGAELDNLILLGKESRGGEEKEWCIDGLDRLAQKVLVSGAYSGCQLESLVNALCAVLLEGTISSTLVNFQSGTALLRRIVYAYYRGRSHPNFADADLGHAVHALSLLGQKALQLHRPGTASECLGVLGTSLNEPNPAISQALREIGMRAIEQDQIAVAMESLGKLDEMLFSGDHLPAEREILYDLIGLLAKFWEHGESGKVVARRDIAELQDDPDVQMTALIDETILHHRSTGRFVAADQIKDMYAEWGQEQIAQPDFDESVLPA